MPPSDLPEAPPQNADRYRILLEASRTLGAKLSPDELHEAIYREAAKALHAPGFFLALHDQGRDLARVVYVAEDGRGEHVDIPYRGSDSEVITKQRAAIIGSGISDGALLSVGEEGSQPTRSGVAAPLMHDGRVLGAISVQSYEEGAYGEADLEMLEGIAGIAAVAIYNSQQFAELERRRREAEQLEEIGRALTSKLDPDQVVGLVISAVSEVLDVDGVAVWLKEPRAPERCRIVDSGGDIALPIGLEWELEGELLDCLVDRHEAVVIDNLATPRSPLPEHIADHLTGGSVLGVPLVLGDQFEGVLTAGSRQARKFNREDIAVLQRLASQACVALANARMHANLHALSLTDPLTGLPNRRRLQIHLEHEVAAARRGRPVSIAVFDIDRFKHYNDTFGHIAGDEILRAVAQELSTANRAMNIVARFGGDEFVSVLSETSMEGARLYIERVQDMVGSNEILAKFGITISVGCAEFDPETMASVNDVFRAADADMYEAKSRRHAELKTGG
jgi:diguanylate cyclase (GGDEF)-like protein